jgi:hypothetical protein
MHLFLAKFESGPASDKNKNTFSGGASTTITQRVPSDDDSIEAFLGNAHSLKYKSKISSVINKYLAMSRELQIEPYPLTSDKSILFVKYMTNLKLSVGTITDYYGILLRELKVQRKSATFDEVSQERVRRALLAAKRILGIPDVIRAVTLTREEVFAVANLEHPKIKSASTLYLVGVCLLLRLREASNLSSRDVSYQGSGRDTIMSLTLQTSKTSQFNPVTLKCRCCCGDVDTPRVCPVHRLKSHIEELGLIPGQGTQRVFQASYSVLARAIKDLLSTFQLPGRASSHSMRRTGAGLLIRGGVSLWEVAEIGRWASPDPLMKTYLRSRSDREESAMDIATKMFKV